jgi:hypothetical protein
MIHEKDDEPMKQAGVHPARFFTLARSPRSVSSVSAYLGSTDLDVIGPNGELIGVGGASKAYEKGKFGRQLQLLKEEAKKRGVPAKMYLEEGVPQGAIDLARKWLGKDNVVIFPK